MNTRAPNTLPRPTDWRDTAACADERYKPIADFWYASDSDITAIRTATTICGHCPAREACLAAAVAEEKGAGDQYVWGVRGGLTAAQRRDLVKRVQKRRAPRAPKPPAPCGTTAAYDRHIRDREPIDDACREAHTEYRRKIRGRRPQSAKCGTRSGYQKHRRNGEQACDPCRQANADADRRLQNTGTTKQLTDDTRRPPAGGARCGTPEGYKAHRRWAEKACPACLEAHRAAARTAADAPSLPTCGTRSGYDTHTARGEAPCRPCTDARERTDWFLRESGTTKPLTERSAA